MYISKHIIQQNIKHENLLKAGKICEACGRKFSENVKRSKIDNGLCEQCQKDIDF